MHLAPGDRAVYVRSYKTELCGIIYLMFVEGGRSKGKLLTNWCNKGNKESRERTGEGEQRDEQTQQREQ